MSKEWNFTRTYDFHEALALSKLSNNPKAKFDSHYRLYQMSPSPMKDIGYIDKTRFFIFSDCSSNFLGLTF